MPGPYDVLDAVEKEAAPIASKYSVLDAVEKEAAPASPNAPTGVVAPWPTPELPRVEGVVTRKARERLPGMKLDELLAGAGEDLYDPAHERKDLQTPFLPVASGVAPGEYRRGQIPIPEGGLLSVAGIPPEGRRALGLVDDRMAFVEASLRTIEGLSSGENLMIMAAMLGTPNPQSKLRWAADVVKGFANGYFSYSMAKGVVDGLENAGNLYAQGDAYGARVALIEAGLIAPMVPMTAVGAKRHFSEPIRARMIEAELNRRAAREQRQAEAEAAKKVEEAAAAPPPAPPPGEVAPVRLERKPAPVEELPQELMPDPPDPADLAEASIEAEVASRSPDVNRAMAEVKVGERPVPGPAEEAGLKAAVDGRRRRKAAIENTIEAPPPPEGTVRVKMRDGSFVDVPLEKVSERPAPPGGGGGTYLTAEEVQRGPAPRGEVPFKRQGDAAPGESYELPPDLPAPKSVTDPLPSERFEHGAVETETLQERFASSKEMVELAGKLEQGMSLEEALTPDLLLGMKVAVQLKHWAEGAEDMAGQVGKYRSVDVQGNEQWFGVKSPLPKELQTGQELKTRADWLRRALNGDAMMGKETQSSTLHGYNFVNTAIDLARRRAGRSGIGWETFLEWVEMYESIAPPNVRKVLSSVGPIHPDYEADLSKWFAKDVVAARSAMGETVPESGISNEFYTMQDGTTIQKMNPPHPAVERMVDTLLEQPRLFEDFQRAVDETLKPLYGIEDPIKVVTTTDRVASSVKLEDGSWEIRMPQLGRSYELLHEIFEIRKARGEKIDVAHDNNSIADKFVQEAIGPRWVEDRPGVMEEWFPEDASRAAMLDDALADTWSLEEKKLFNAFSSNAAGPLEVYGKQFYEQTLKPKAEAVAEGLGQLFKGLVNIFMPEHGAAEKFLDDFGSAKGKMAREMDYVALNAFERKWNRESARMSRLETIENIDAFERGAPLPNEKLRTSGMAEFMHEVSDRVFRKVSPYKKDMGYQEHWMSHVWTAKSMKKLKAENPRLYNSLLGGEWWSKKRMVAFFKEGLKLKLEPVTWDFFELWKRGVTAEWRYATGMEVWNKMLQNGARQFVPKDATPPPDWVPFDFDNRLKYRRGSPEGQTSFAETGEGAGSMKGQWYVEPNAARVLRNWLSRDVMRSVKAMNWFLNVVNLDKAITLAWPAFHTFAETAHSAGADLQYGLRGMIKETAHLVAASPDFSPGELVRSVANAANAATLVGPAVRRVRLGNRYIDYVKDPKAWLESNRGQDLLEKHPEFIRDGELLYGAGMKLGGRASYYQNYVDSIWKAFKDHNPLTASTRMLFGAVPALASAIASPTFRWYIPRLKLGAALIEMGRAREMYAMELASGKMSEQALARRVYESIENRFGEIEFDNWFWHRITSRVLQLALLSPSWTGGDIKLAGVGLTRQVQELKAALATDPIAYMKEHHLKGVKGYLSGVRAPRLTYEMQSLLSVLTFGVIAQSILQKTLSGSWPGEATEGTEGPTPIKDVVYSRTGALDENGHPIRIALPGYESAYYIWATHPFKHLVNAMAPMPKRIGEAIVGKKSYSGEEVVNPLDSGPKQFLDALAYAGFGSWPVIGEGPFSAQQVERLYEAGAPKPAIASSVLMGARTAGKYLDETDGEEAIRLVHMRSLPSSRTPEAVARAEKTKIAMERIKNGADPESVMLSMSDAPETQRRRLLQSMKKSQYEVWFGSMGLREALEIWPKLSSKEKAVFRRALKEKKDRAQAGRFAGFSPSELPELQKRLLEALGIQEEAAEPLLQ